MKAKIVKSTSRITDEVEATLIDGSWNDGLAIVCVEGETNLPQERRKWIEFRDRASMINSTKAVNQASNIIQHLEMEMDNYSIEY